MRDMVIEAQHRIWRLVGGITVHGLEWGDDGPLALLLHANGLCAATWSTVARQLASRYRVIALDARGHGASSKPIPPDAYEWQLFVDDVAEVCGQILGGSERSGFELAVGSSLGGIIVAALAAEQPGIFQRIVMLDPPVLPGEEIARELGAGPRVAAKRGGNIADQARNRRSVWPSRKVVGLAYRKKPMFAKWEPGAFQDYLEAGFQDREDGQIELACAPDVEASIFELTGSLDIFERAKSVREPVTLVRAGGGYFPLQIFEHLAHSFPRCELVELQGGHLLPVETPDETAQFLLELECG